MHLIKMRYKTTYTLNKVTQLVDTNATYATCSK
jgi:hypothetical protein